MQSEHINRIKILQEKYLEEIKHFEEAIDIGQTAISIPRIIAKYQFTYYDLLNEYSEVNNEQEELYHTKTFSYKIGQSDLAHISLSASEIKKMIETSEEYRKLTMKKSDISNQMKLVEQMMDTIKNFTFSINNKIKFTELVGGQ